MFLIAVTSGYSRNSATGEGKEEHLPVVPKSVSCWFILLLMFALDSTVSPENCYLEERGCQILSQNILDLGSSLVKLGNIFDKMTSDAISIINNQQLCTFFFMKSFLVRITS